MLADRDYEIETRVNSDRFIEDLKNEWNSKTKSEKQEFISRFIESMVPEKDPDYHEINIKQINFRSRYLEEIQKLRKCDSYEFARPSQSFEDVEIKRGTKIVTEKEKNEYIDRLKKYYDIKFYDDPHDWSNEGIYGDFNYPLYLPRKNKDEKIIRSFVINNHKEFPLIDENGNARGKYGLVTYKEKTQNVKESSEQKV